MSIEDILTKISNTDVITSNHYQYKGSNVPRVTEILSLMLHEDFLMIWANSIGLYKNQKYKKVLEDAANKGSYVHEAIEQFLQNSKELDKFSVELRFRDEVSNAYASFRMWWDIISKNNVEILMEESPLVCPWFGGTLDLLIKINGRIYLLDFKTSNHPSYKYFLQLSAYRYILRKYYGIEIYGCGIIMLSKKEINFAELIIDKSFNDYMEFMEQCETTFLSLVYAFYNRLNVEKMYNNIFM